MTRLCVSKQLSISECLPNGLCLVVIVLVIVGCGRQPSNSQTELSITTSQNGSNVSPDRALQASVDTMPTEVLETTGKSRSALPDDWMEDITELSGIQFTYRTGLESRQYAMVEELGGGVALFDFDRDGDLDVFFAGGGVIASGQIPQGLPGSLFRNDGNMHFTDVTKQVGLDQPGDYSHGVTVGDYDRDGWEDIFVACYGRSRLFRNLEGRAFRDQTEEAGLGLDGWYPSAAFLDFNNDGWLDLFVCGYVAWRPGEVSFYGDPKLGLREVAVPAAVPAIPSLLFRGGESGKFTNVSQAAGFRQDGKALGVVAADLNQDGWIDLYVANDIGPNHLYLGAKELPFREVGFAAGVFGSEFGIAESSMGIDAGDFDGDGLLDLFVTNFEREDNSLYRNEGAGLFTHRTVAAGLAGRCRSYVGFGTEFLDLDMDGWLDLYIVNGHVLYHDRQSPYRQPALAYQNHQGIRYADISSQVAPYFNVTHVGRGAAHGDLDNDGDLDLVVVHQNEPATILRNRRAPSNWLCLALEGTVSNREAIGAIVKTRWEERDLTRVIRGGGGYLSCSDRRILVPCSSALQKVDVSWPSGSRERFTGIAPGQRRVLREGTGDLSASVESRSGR